MLDDLINALHGLDNGFPINELPEDPQAILRKWIKPECLEDYVG